jgi:hypothetical protein
MSSGVYYKVIVSSDGETYDLSSDVDSFTIDEQLTMADKLTLNLNDPYKVLSHALVEGLRIKIDLGTTDDHSIVFSGSVYEVSGDFPQDGTPKLQVIAQDASMAMGLVARDLQRTGSLQRIFTDIAETQEYNSHFDISAKLDIDPAIYIKKRQNGQTDREFLKDLAVQYDYQLYAVPGEELDRVEFVSTISIIKQDPKVELKFRCDVGNRLLSFHVDSKISQVKRPKKYSIYDFTSGKLSDPTTKNIEYVKNIEDRHEEENFTAFEKEFPEKADKLKTFLGSVKNARSNMIDEWNKSNPQPIVTHAWNLASTQQDAPIKGQHQVNTLFYGMMASGMTSGNPNLHAQKMVAILDSGRFSGDWFVTKALHTLNDEGYKTEFECQR